MSETCLFLLCLRSGKEKMKEIGIYNYEVFIPVMLPGSTIREKLLTESLFIDTRTEGS